MKIDRKQHRAFLFQLALEAMRERGFEPEFSAATLAAVEALPSAPPLRNRGARDAVELPWCSIDNDDSRDLDQLTVAEALDRDEVRIYVAIADVCSRVDRDSEIDRHARLNTTTVYTPPHVFSMLPERLSTDLTSLNPGQDRLAIVVEAGVLPDGVVGASAVYRGIVRNHAQLAYPSLGAWLEGEAPMPQRVGTVPGLASNLRLQNRIAGSIETYRHEQGALVFAPTEVKAVFEGDTIRSLEHQPRNRAQELIENCMILANGVIAKFLTDRGFPVLRRVVRSPKRWQRIRELAQDTGEHLPGEPDASALQSFLGRRRLADPLRFPDLSLSIIKLLGRGEYVASFPGQAAIGHFGLAVSDYTHSTAPNRRYPDIITQRLVLAALAGKPCPYGRGELEKLAQYCTEKEDDAKRVERRLVKSAAALLIGDRLGQVFDGIVTAAGEAGTWVRIFDPPVEGRVERRASGLDVGERVRVKLLFTDPEKGFIDFECIGHRPIGRRSLHSQPRG